MTVYERIEWAGEFALTLMFLGVVFAIVRMNGLPVHHPIVALPMVWRLIVFLAFAVTLTMARVWVANWRKHRRQQIGRAKP